MLLTLCLSLIFVCFPQQQQQSTNGPFKVDPSYTSVANASGGQAFAVPPAEMGKMGEILSLTYQPDAAQVLLLNDTSSHRSKIYVVPVDATATKAIFSISGTAATTVTLKRPDGTIVQPGSAGLKHVAWSNGAVYSIANPGPGDWNVAITGQSEFSLKVVVSSPLQFDDFSFVAKGGRPGHEGYFPVKGAPLAARQSTVQARFSEKVQVTEFQLRSAAGKLLGTFQLDGTPGGAEFFGTLTVPSTSFRVYALGMDSKGRPFQRTLSHLITPKP